MSMFGPQYKYQAITWPKGGGDPETGENVEFFVYQLRLLACRHESGHLAGNR